MTSCTENYSNGERIGLITKFSEKGLVWKSWEGHLNTTQTGMNSGEGFDFSVDNDINDPKVISALDSAATNGWKVKIKYHQTFGYNWLGNRGETDYFVSEVDILDRNPIGNLFSNTTNQSSNNTSTKNVSNSNCTCCQNGQCKVSGKTIDTIYVVIKEK